MRSVLRLEGLARPALTSPDLTADRCVLVLEYRVPLGCCVHLTPVFAAIKSSRPRLQIAVATHHTGLAALRYNPFVDHLIETPDALQHTLQAVRTLRRALRSRGIVPDAVLTGASDQRSRMALLGMLATSAWRGGFSVRSNLYQRPLVYDSERSLIDNNLQLAGLLGCSTEHREPCIFFSDADVELARRLRESSVSGQKPLVLMVTQTSGGQATGWHVDRFAAVVQFLKGEGVAVAYLGTDSERERVEEIRRRCGSYGVSMAGKTNVSQLAALMANSDYVVSVDTGTMHVGRAAGVPMVVLGPSWQQPLEWLPIGVENVRILRGEDRVPAGPGYQLDEITPEMVVGAISDLRVNFPPSAAMREGRLRRGLSLIDHRDR